MSSILTKKSLIWSKKERTWNKFAAKFFFAAKFALLNNKKVWKKKMEILNKIETILAEPATPVVLTVVYLASVFILQRILPRTKDKEKNRKISGYYDNLTLAHNLILTVESAWMAYGLITTIFSIYQEIGFDGIHCDSLHKFQNSKGFIKFLVKKIL